MTSLWRTVLASLICLLATVSSTPAADPPRPNILWLTCEDMGPHLGCFGDDYATSPNIDALAKKGVRYQKVWSCAPVCAPARTTLISGLYPPSTGAEHMRSQVSLPAGMKMFPQYLRAAGYYCTNNVKEDYNLEKPAGVWDVSSAKAHWKNRKAGQPFFAVFNHVITHESQFRTRPHKAVHDPAKVKLPAYHPDTPEVRQDWAQYYDNITTMDTEVGAKLKDLEEAGLVEDTIIFFYSDHGSGMPRNKRFPGESGLHVPMIVVIPEKFRSLATKEYVVGGETDRLVSFVDFAPTVLSLAGLEAPETFQGQAFLGPFAAPPKPFNFAFRGRMDERYDLSRSATDGRYVYIRNYMPHRPWGQYLDYMFQTPTTRVWKKLFDEGKLTPEQAQFFQPKPPEELYDLQTDPDEVHNLAGAAEHQAALAKLRKAQQDLALKIRDVGFLPENEMHARSEGSTPYEMGHDNDKYPFAEVIAAADLASNLDPAATPRLKELLAAPDSAVRYWAALGLRMRGKEGVLAAHKELLAALTDRAASVRTAAAEGLGLFGESVDRVKSVEVLLELSSLSKNGPYVPVMALNSLDALGLKDPTLSARLDEAAAGEVSIPQRLRNYVPRLVEKIKKDSQP